MFEIIKGKLILFAPWFMYYQSEIDRSLALTKWSKEY